MDAETIKAIAELAWPLLAAVILLALLPTIKGIVKSRSVSIKYGQMELSVQDASDQFRKQIDDLQVKVQALERALPPSPDRVAQPATIPPALASRVRTILWVDDKPEGNAHEIAKLGNEGWEIWTVRSTNEALDRLAQREILPTVIISDMARREGLAYRRSAGLDLIREIRARKMNVPIIIYTISRVDDYRKQVTDLGGNGITSSPIELFQMLENAA